MKKIIEGQQTWKFLEREKNIFLEVRERKIKNYILKDKSSELKLKKMLIGFAKNQAKKKTSIS